jgi:hypothetical protein
MKTNFFPSSGQFTPQNLTKLLHSRDLILTSKKQGKKRSQVQIITGGDLLLLLNLIKRDSPL